MKNMLKKAIGIVMGLAMISTSLAASAAAPVEKVKFTKLVDSNYAPIANVVYRWEYGDKKPGVYKKSDSGASNRVSDAQYAAVVTGSTTAFMYPVTTEHGGYRLSMFAYGSNLKIPYTADKAYFEFEIYTTTDLTMKKIDFPAHATDNAWPTLTYNKELALSQGAWHTVSLPLSEFKSSDGKYTCNNCDRLDRIEFVLPSTITENCNVYLKNANITYVPTVTAADVITTNGTLSSSLGGSKGLKLYNSDNYDAGSAVTDAASPYANARKWTVKAKAQSGTKIEKLVFEWGHSNKQNFTADSFIEMEMYIDADDADSIEIPSKVRLTTSDGWKTTDTALSSLKRKEWNYIKVPVAGGYISNIYDTQILFSSPSDATVAYDLYIRNFRITNGLTAAMGTDIKKAGDTGSVTAGTAVKFNNYSDTNNMIVAVYDSNDKLVNVVSADNLGAQYTVQSGEKVRAMLWNNLNEISPICGNIMLTAN
ncbi:MAG: hypothetical protein PUF72_10930 [Clostridiales bacterium]|nr:hypothetical protein [Clostridiales bacterium]